MILSFASLEVNEFGLDYSSITKTVSDRPWTGGLHFLKVGHSFLKFPKTVQTVEFSNTAPQSNGPAIKSRTQDGLEVVLEISFQFKYSILYKESAFTIFKEYLYQLWNGIQRDI